MYMSSVKVPFLAQIPNIGAPQRAVEPYTSSITMETENATMGSIINQ